MNNNQVKNPKTEVPTGTNLNDKDYISSLLSSLKDMVKNYTVALTEASNESLYQEYKDMFDTYIDLQRETYELMFRKGWYVLEQAEGETTGSKYNTLNQEFIDLNG